MPGQSRELMHGKAAPILVIVIVLALLGGVAVPGLLELPGAIDAGRKGLARCALPEVSGGAGGESCADGVSKRLEAFLEMLAAERGAARLTLAAYRNDLADLDRLSRRRAAPRWTWRMPAACTTISPRPRRRRLAPRTSRGGFRRCASSTNSC